MEFEQAYTDFMSFHVQRRTGERKGRLLTRNFHGEKLFLQNIWLPYKGTLDHLHPEYEVKDWRGRSYFIDYAWKSPWNLTILFEIKGYGKHVRDLDRNGFNNDTNRDTFLQAIGYHVVSFTYDDVVDHPELCLTLLKLFLSQFQTVETSITPTALTEKEIIKLALRLARPFRPIDVSRHLEIDYRTSMKYIVSLLAKNWIIPTVSATGKRTVIYEVVKGIVNLMNY